MTRPPDPESYSPLLAPLGAAAIVAGIFLGNALGLVLAALGFLLLAVSCWSRRDGFLLIGPFPRIELLRAIRRQRIHLWWGLIAGIVGIAVVVGYGFVAYGGYTRDQVAFASTMVVLFCTWNLFLIVMSVSLTMMSYAIAEDRDGKRLDFVLASDLRSREIIVGKLVGRLYLSLTYLAVLLPIAIVLPVLFGIDPLILIAITAFLLVSILSLSGIALLSSTMAATKKAGGTVMTLFVLPYMAITFGLEFFRGVPEVWFFPGTPQMNSTVSFGDVADFINAGNPILIVQQWFAGAYASAAADFQHYAAMHIGFFFAAILLAIRLLRSNSAKLAETQTTPGADVKPVPPVSERPVLWKERYFIASQVQARRKRIVRIIAMLVLAPGILFLLSTVSDLGGYAQKIQDLSKFYVPLLVWIFSVAGSRMGLEAIVRERDKDTLTSLLLTDYTPRQIITEKLLGLLRVFLPVWIAIAIIAVTTVICGGMLWWTALGAIAMLVIFGTFLIVLGIHTSASATSLEACSKTFGLKLVPFILLPPLCLMATMMAPLGSTENQVIGAIVVTIIAMIYIAVGQLFWYSAVKRFERTCDPAAEAGPMLASAAVNP